MQQSSPEGTESEFASEPIDRPPSVSSPSQVFKMNAHTHKHLYVHTRVTKSCNFVLNFKLNFHNKFALHFFFIRKIHSALHCRIIIKKASRHPNPNTAPRHDIKINEVSNLMR